LEIIRKRSNFVGRKEKFMKEVIIRFLMKKNYVKSQDSAT
jgi:hypothetical protein